eukprot:15455340-Alexandrium_andersonii.AAC.1
MRTSPQHVSTRAVTRASHLGGPGLRGLTGFLEERLSRPLTLGHCCGKRFAHCERSAFQDMSARRLCP